MITSKIVDHSITPPVPITDQSWDVDNDNIHSICSTHSHIRPLSKHAYFPGSMLRFSDLLGFLHVSP